MKPAVAAIAVEHKATTAYCETTRATYNLAGFMRFGRLIYSIRA